MSKFKVGDKVKRVIPWQGTTNRPLGYVGYVTAVLSTGDICVDEEGVTSSHWKLEEDTSKRRPHYDLIIAWANGAEIECRFSSNTSWSSIKNPGWLENFEYRIKLINPEERELEQHISDMYKQLADAKKRLKEIAGE